MIILFRKKVKSILIVSFVPFLFFIITSLLVTQLVMQLLKWIMGQLKIYQLTTKTVNCKTVNKTLRFQPKRSSSYPVFYKKSALKNFGNLEVNTCAQSLFLIKFIKIRDSGTVVFLWILRMFRNTFSTEHVRATTSGLNVLAKFETKIAQFKATSFSLQLELLTNLCKKEKIK